MTVCPACTRRTPLMIPPRIKIDSLLVTYIWGVVIHDPTKAHSCRGNMVLAQQQSIDFVNIVVAITVIMGATFSNQYPSTGFPIKCKRFSLTCAYPCMTSILETLVVIRNFIIVVDISIIFVILSSQSSIVNEDNNGGGITPPPFPSPPCFYTSAISPVYLILKDSV